MSYTLFYDTETTGLNSEINSIIQIAGVICDNNFNIVEEFNYFVKPAEIKSLWSKRSLEKNKLSEDKIETFDEIYSVRKQLENIFTNYSQESKIDIVGYKCDFDNKFLLKLWKDSGLKMGDLFNYIDFKNSVDLLNLIRYLRKSKFIEVENCKLDTVCSYFNIEIDAHEALSDIKATYEIFKLLNKRLKFS